MSDEKIESHADGIKTIKFGEHIIKEFHTDEVLNYDPDHPRNIFLVGQLHIEMYCDWIINGYFNPKPGRRLALLNNFLKSGRVGFNDKIKLLETLTCVLEHQSTNPIDILPIKLIDKNVLNSLKLVGAIRNAYAHYLDPTDALQSFNSCDYKFQFTLSKKLLKEYKDTKELADDYKIEVNQLYLKLYEYSIKLWRDEIKI